MYSRSSVVMVDEIINSSPPNYRFPDAGLRIMITNHFGPKTRLRMASRLIINEVGEVTGVGGPSGLSERSSVKVIYLEVKKARLVQLFF